MYGCRTDVSSLHHVVLFFVVFLMIVFIVFKVAALSCVFDIYI